MTRSGNGAPTRPTLLVVDDEVDVLQSIRDLFRLEYRVLTAERGEEAIGLLVANEVHVVLTDQRMPGMSGVDVLREAARLRPETTRLLFTGYADLSAVVDAINQGSVFRYLSKPWEQVELELAIRQGVERHQLLTDRKRLVEELERANAELREANQVKQRFIEVASHELNTPVGVVLGLAELWKISQGPAASEAERGWVDRIQHAGERLAAMAERMGQLLRADRFETLDLRPTELAPLIHDTLSDLGPFLADRRQKIDVRLEEGLGTVEVDPAKLSDVVANLVVNAIKFTPDGGRIEVEAQCQGPDSISLRVADQGVGIAPEDRRFLFEPFFTGRDTRHHSSGRHEFGKKGIGLGLCLVKTFVGLHGGHVDVRGAPNEGTQFIVVLPRRAGAAQPSPGPEGLASR